MDNGTLDKRLTDDQIVTAPSSRRRLFLKLLGGGVLGATAVAAGIGRTERAEAKQQFEPLWNSAQVLIGNSPEDQEPSLFIKCPLFFDNGHFANAFHTLDLRNLPTVIGTVTHHNDTIVPDNSSPSSSIAVAITKGSDDIYYLVVAGEGEVTGGTGYFSGVTKAILRCKYKVAGQDDIRLIACVDCVVVLIRH